MADDLVAFLRARYDEDEQVATAATPGPWVAGGIGDFGWSVSGPSGGVEADDSEAGRADAEHIARHDPARALAEVAAKRRVLDAWPDSFGQWSADQADAARAMKTAVLLLLALPYAGHPDYREEWRP